MKYYYYILILTNLIALIVYAIDKFKAKYNKWRIPEKTLITLAFFGPIGACFSMYFFRHKTQKKKFTLTIPVFIIIQIAITYAVYQFLL